MSREWKAGDMARTIAGGTIARTARHKWILLDDGHPIHCDDDRISRPLVVIDYQDAEQVERLIPLLYHSGAFPGARPVPMAAAATVIANALREFADPTPSIEEPMGLGAVVETEKGARAVRTERFPDQPWDYTLCEDGGFTWDQIPVVRILSHGVTEGES